MRPGGFLLAGLVETTFRDVAANAEEPLPLNGSLAEE
jgi:hypothetical protein